MDEQENFNLEQKPPKTDTPEAIKPFDAIKPSAKKEGSKKLFFWLDIALNLVIIVGMVVIIRSFLISPFQVFGPSMCNTLNYVDEQCQNGYGEYLIVNKLGYQNFFGYQVGLPKRGDIIVFHPPHNQEEFFIKRVIGLPGEVVKLENGHIYISNKENPTGFQLTEEYLSSNNRGNSNPDKLTGRTVFEVPAGQYFVMGDNRLQSSDSRHCFRDSSFKGDCGEGQNSHFLPLENIEGKAWLILWPLNHISTISNPNYSEKPPA